MCSVRFNSGKLFFAGRKRGTNRREEHKKTQRFVSYMIDNDVTCLSQNKVSIYGLKSLKYFEHF